MSGDSNWTRREFLSATAAGVIGIRHGRSSRTEERFAYVGTYTRGTKSEGIYRLLLDTTSGAMRVDGVAAKSDNPSFLALHPNGRVLYAVNEVDDFGGQPTGGVSPFRIVRDSGALVALNAVASNGKSPCYVSVDRGGRAVLVANYGSGTVAGFAVRQDGALARTLATVQHEGRGPNADRQTGPHAHCIMADPDSRHVLAADLGIDAVVVYGFDGRSGSMATSGTRIALKPGAGPRHLAFHPNGRFLYVINELDSTLAVYAYNSERGSADQVQVTPASPDGKAAANYPADVHVARSGRFLYASNRGEDSIAVFAIDPTTGQLTAVQQVATGGKWPRNFTLDPTGGFLLVANQRSDSILSFRVDQETGRLTPTGQQVLLASPVCVLFR
jgi:6-phosphogluconolactonase